MGFRRFPDRQAEVFNEVVSASISKPKFRKEQLNHDSEILWGVFARILQRTEA